MEVIKCIFFTILFMGFLGKSLSCYYEDNINEATYYLVFSILYLIVILGHIVSI